MADNKLSKGQKNSKENKKNKSYNYKYNRNTYKVDESTNRLFLYPVIFVIAVLPLIMKMKIYDTNMNQYNWFPNNKWEVDFFLYYKQWFFVATVLIMLLFIIYKAYSNRKSLKITPVLIPLFVYAFFSILSTIFSEYKSYSLLGSRDQFESLFVLLGYCILIVYISYYVNTEKDVKFIILFLSISVLTLTILGGGQYLGKDLFTTEFGKKLITPSTEWNSLDDFKMMFAKGRVYLTLYNPNYVGIYVALVAPVILTLLLFSKKLINSIFYVILLIGLIVILIGSQSLAGLIGLGIAIIGVLIFLWRYLIKRFYVFLPVIAIIVITLLIVNDRNDNFMINRVKTILKVEENQKNLNSISTEDEYVSIDYKGNKLNISMNIDDTSNSMSFNVTDGNGTTVNYTYDAETSIFNIQDDRFPSFTFSPVMYEELLSFYIRIDNKDWIFTNQTEDGTYYYFNQIGRLDKIITAPSSVFTKYERIASNRGYIWSRTIPLIKNHIILGSGADTFVFEFPQQDYVNINHYFGNQLVTKPHSLYLQIAVQTGVISLIAFIVFYFMYFISSIKLYIRGRFNNYYAQLGLGIMMGTFGYMISALTNDSSITVAPVFWCLLGLGIVVNNKAKPLILQERKAILERRKN